MGESLRYDSRRFRAGAAFRVRAITFLEASVILLERWAGRGLPVLVFLSAAGCSSAARVLDPAFNKETHRAVMKFRFEPGITDPGILKQFQTGDIITFSSSEPSSASSFALSAAMSQISHVAIVFEKAKHFLVLTADSERGVAIETIPACVRSRSFYVFAFPPEVLDAERLALFAERAALLGRLDYNWSAIFGWNSNLTPNTLQEVADEYTCATVVAAALHFSGLSLDRAYRGVVTPGDIVFSIGRRNLNGPSAAERARRRKRLEPRDPQEEIWGDLR